MRSGLYPASIDDEFLTGAHRAVIGGEEQHHGGNVLRHQFIGQALAFLDFRFRRVIDKLRQEFDYVIIDSHDLSTVADTYLMGQHCDAVIVCARKYVSRKPLVEQAFQKVCDLGVPHAGLIFMGEAAK